MLQPIRAKLVTAYGSDACKEGYVWRDAFSGDKVCVTPAVRSQATADNAAAASRWVVGAYGPHTCIAGYVWREAQSGDDVCVLPGCTDTGCRPIMRQPLHGLPAQMIASAGMSGAKPSQATRSA